MITTATSFAGSTVVLMARVLKSDGTSLTTADVSTMTLTAAGDDAPAFQPWGACQTPTPIVPTPVTLSPADCVYSSLQTDSRWTRDSVGYNVAVKVTLPEIVDTYDVRVTMTLVNGDVLVAGWSITVE